MHWFKRFAGIMLAMVLIMSSLPAASARQFYDYMLDAEDKMEIAVMLDAITEQNFVNTDAATVCSYIEHFLYDSNFSAINGGRFPYTNAQGYWAGKTVSDGTYSQVVSATGCFAYCKLVTQVIYGEPGARRNLDARAGRITAEALKSFLMQYAQAGEHIRVDGKHSVTFVSGDENGFYFLDYAGDQNPRIWLRYTSYRNFAAHCNGLYKRVWIYEANNALNSEVVHQPAAWMEDYIEAAEQLGLFTSGTNVNYNGALTLAETVTFAARVHSLLTIGGTEFYTENAVNWYDPYVAYLKGARILTSDLDYSAKATREQFVSLLYACFPADMKLDTLNQSVSFADVDEISDPVAAYVMCCSGILTGVEKEGGIYFDPDGLISRGEALVLLTRLAVPEYRVS